MLLTTLVADDILGAFLQLSMTKNSDLNATLPTSASSTNPTHPTSRPDALASISGLGTPITLLMSFSGLRDWLKLIVLGGALETLRRPVSSVWEWLIGRWYSTGLPGRETSPGRGAFDCTCYSHWYQHKASSPFTMVTTVYSDGGPAMSTAEGAAPDISQEVRLFAPLHNPHRFGGFSDVFRGKRGTELVAMKHIRVPENMPEVIQRRFVREHEIWKELKHPNILEFYGIAKHGGSSFMISPFLENGDAPTWLAPRAGERLRVVFEAAMGCLYLHTLPTQPIVHGDLKGANILIKGDGQAVLTDFGLSKTMGTVTSRGLKCTGTAPYMAPELFPQWDDPEEEYDDSEMLETKTLETDVFAFGRTTFELLSGKIPFSNASTPKICLFVQQGRHPTRPKSPEAERWITDAMCEFINEMTDVEPGFRPTMLVVKETLQKFHAESRGIENV